VDENLANGPLKDRKCTDILFFLIFVAFFSGYGYTSNYAFANGRPDELFRPVNGDGMLCGVDTLLDYKKLYYIFSTTDPTTPRAVCVDHCPAEVDSAFECHGTEAIPAEVCRNELSSRNGTNLTNSTSGYFGYGTHSLLKRFCIPDLDKLPPQIDLDQYDNLIG